MSTHFWDENPKGIWTLLLENRGDDQNTGGYPIFTGVTLCLVILPSPTCMCNLLASPCWPPALLLGCVGFEGLPGQQQDTTPKLPAPSPCPCCPQAS